MGGFVNSSLVLMVVYVVWQSTIVSGAYSGKLIGELSRLQHGVRGKVYAASNKRLYIKEFYYDGNGPDAFAWMGTTDRASREGTIIPVNGSTGVLRGFSNGIARVDLPEGKTLSDYKWLSIWCRRFRANFGEIAIPADLVTPAPRSLGSLGFNPRVHDVHAEEVIIVNHRQLQLINLDYDGNGPDAYYWAGTGGTPSVSGFALADESRGGSTSPLPTGVTLQDKTVTVTIPASQGDIFSIGHFGLWCHRARQDFGHVDIPSELNVPPYDAESAVPVDPTEETSYTPPVTLDNCKVLIDNTYQVRWSVSGSNIMVALSARINPGTYMAFGLSGSDSRTQMVDSDVTVTWLDEQTGAAAYAVDYYLSAYQQCVVNSGSGACTDEISIPSGANDVTVGDHSNENGIITISYTKALDTGDTNADKVIPTNQAVYVSWAIGPINPSGLAAKHRQQPSSDVLINFGQQSSSCAPFTVGVKKDLPAWEIPALGKDGKTVFQLDIGQAGGQQGYEGITGSPGWGIAWYVDEYIIPVLTLKRNVTYTFKVNGGNNENVQASYHPFYITSDPEGGYFQKTAQEKQGVEIYAGPVQGSLCEWRSTGSYNADDFDKFTSYRDSALRRECDPPEAPATLTWTPDKNTPDLVYYQCYTHKFLGYKINIVDEYTDGSLPATSVSLLTLIVTVTLTILML